MYSETGECRGASGRKLRQVCVWCPCYDKWRQKCLEKERTKDHGSDKG